MIEVLSLSDIRERIGTELGKSEWLTMEQGRINAFADCTGDQQWIHVDETAAANGPFGKTIAHGFLTLSLIPHFSSDIGVIPENTAMAVNYGMDKVRLISPVPVGSRIRDTIILGDVTEKDPGRILMKTTHIVEIEGVDKPACVADTLTMFFVQA